MRAMIVDTDVVSYIYKKDSRAAKYEPHLVNAITSISFIQKQIELLEKSQEYRCCPANEEDD